MVSHGLINIHFLLVLPSVETTTQTSTNDATSVTTGAWLVNGVGKQHVAFERGEFLECDDGMI